MSETLQAPAPVNPEEHARNQAQEQAFQYSNDENLRRLQLIQQTPLNYIGGPKAKAPRGHIAPDAQASWSPQTNEAQASQEEGMSFDDLENLFHGPDAVDPMDDEPKDDTVLLLETENTKARKAALLNGNTGRQSQAAAAPAAAEKVTETDDTRPAPSHYGDWMQARLDAPHFTTARQREVLTYGRHASGDFTPNVDYVGERRHAAPEADEAVRTRRAARLGRGILRATGLSWAGNQVRETASLMRENAADIKDANQDYAAQRPTRRAERAVRKAQKAEAKHGKYARRTNELKRRANELHVKAQQ